MTGKELQLKIKASGRTQKELAQLMGMDPTQWTSIFRQDDVKSGIVEQVARLLGKSVGQFYGEGDHIEATNHSTAFKGMSTSDPQLLEIIAEQGRQITHLIAQHDRLLELMKRV